MAATLVFDHGGWTVATVAWTAASKRPDRVTICYAWSSSGTIGWVDLATGTARVDLKMDMATFLRRVAAGGAVDLRGCQ